MARNTSSRKSEAARRNIKKAQEARRGMHTNFGNTNARRDEHGRFA